MLGVTGGQWQIVRGGGTGTWEPLGGALTSSLAGLVVADFDGDGVADVGRTTASGWEYAPAGRGGFGALRSGGSLPPLTSLPIGRFNAGATADVLLWSDRHFAIAPDGRNPISIWSRQSMR